MARVLKPEQTVKHCGGGNVQFGVTGQSLTVYATKFQLCISPFQDAHYGKGQRLHNGSGKEEGHPRCTVCGFGNGIVRP